jgi:hypothetical protein
MATALAAPRRLQAQGLELSPHRGRSTCALAEGLLAWAELAPELELLEALHDRQQPLNCQRHEGLCAVGRAHAKKIDARVPGRYGAKVGLSAGVPSVGREARRDGLLRLGERVPQDRQRLASCLHECELTPEERRNKGEVSARATRLDTDRELKRSSGELSACARRLPQNLASVVEHAPAGPWRACKRAEELVEPLRGLAARGACRRHNRARKRVQLENGHELTRASAASAEPGSKVSQERVGLRDQRCVVGSASLRDTTVTDAGISYRVCLSSAKRRLMAGNLGDAAAAVRDLRERHSEEARRDPRARKEVGAETLP